jgi:aminocarboxymuconate-semialdehyde decarboxylase
VIETPYRDIRGRPQKSSFRTKIQRAIAVLQVARLDHQVMSVTPLLFAYLRKPEHASDCAHLFNDMALEMCARSGGCIHAVAQVPLQDVDASCREVERAMKNGHIGVEIGNHVGDKDFDDEGIVTFLHHCADIGCPVLEHPWDMMGRKRMKRYMLPWLVAMPAETHLAMLYLILSGALERLPQSLRICFAHGGGNFAFTLGRVENAWKNRDIVREDCPHPPSSYVKRFWCENPPSPLQAQGSLASRASHKCRCRGTFRSRAPATAVAGSPIPRATLPG